MSEIIRDIRAIVRELWIIAFIMSLLALIIHEELSLWTIALSIAIATGYGLAFALNDYYDQAYDIHNPEKSERNFFVRSGFSRTVAIGLLFIFVSFMFLVFAHFGVLGIVMFFLSMFVLWGYSSPPLRFKSRVGWDVIVPMLFMHSYPYLLTMIVLGIPFELIDIGILSLLMITSVASQFEQQIRDFEYDAEIDHNTTQRIGLKKSIVIMQVLSVILVVVYFVQVYFQILPQFLKLTALIYLIFIIPRFTDPESGKNERNSRIATIIFLGIMIYVLLTSPSVFKLSQ